MRKNESLSEIINSELPLLEVDLLSGIQQVILSMTLPKDEEYTGWEKEFVVHRQQAILYNQDRLITKINSKIDEFNEKVALLLEERLKLEVNAKFMDQFLLTLNQELWVLKDFEQLEEILMVKIEQLIYNRNEVYANLTKDKLALEAKKREISEFEEKQNEIEAQFTMQCNGDPYWKYFKRIFYKKWKPPKIQNEDEDKEYCKYYN